MDSLFFWGVQKLFETRHVINNCLFLPLLLRSFAVHVISLRRNSIVREASCVLHNLNFLFMLAASVSLCGCGEFKLKVAQGGWPMLTRGFPRSNTCELPLHDGRSSKLQTRRAREHNLMHKRTENMRKSSSLLCLFFSQSSSLHLRSCRTFNFMFVHFL